MVNDLGACGRGALLARSILVSGILAVGLGAGCAASSAGRRGGESPDGSISDMLAGCAEARRAQARCGGPAGGEGTSVRRGLRPFGEGIAAGVATEAVVTNDLMGSDLTLSIVGNHRVVWWNLGAGALHLYDDTAVGFSVCAGLGVRLEPASPWSVFVGAKLLNVSDFYAGASEHPAHHILGRVGIDLAAYERPTLSVRLRLQALMGAARRRVAHVEQARVVADDRFLFSYGGAFSVSVWMR